MWNNLSKLLPRELREWLFAPRVDGKRIKFNHEFEKIDEMDPRTRQMGWFWGGVPYQTKVDSKVMEPLSIKSQQPYNTCGWQSCVGAWEIVCGKIFSSKFLVAMGKRAGKVINDGLSYTSSNQIVLKDSGVCEESDYPDNKDKNFNEYSKEPPTELQVKALDDRSKDFAWVKGRDEVLRALDEGRPIQVGGAWYSGWTGQTVSDLLGQYIGGHAVYINGFKNKGVFLRRTNSWGENWGNKGGDWLTLNLFLRVYGGGYITFPLDENALANFLRVFEGKDVKANGSAIYRIQGGVKRPFPDSATFFAFGGRFNPPTFQAVDNGLLNRIIMGDQMDIRESSNWPLIQDNWDLIQKLSEPANLKMIQKLLTPQGVWDKIKSYVKK